MRRQIPCAGQHSAAVTVGIVELPDGTPPEQMAAATGGYLCEDCGGVYALLQLLDATPVANWSPAIRAAFLAAGGTNVDPKQPSAGHVDALLAFLGRQRQRPR